MFQKTSSCFTNQMFYVRNMPIRSYTINKITFIINTITTTIIIIILIFNFNITIIIIIIIIITIIIKSIIVIIILSFVLHFFNIRSLCVTFLFEFICVLFNYLFLIIYWPLIKYLVDKYLRQPFFFFNWDSPHARLNSHYEAWSYKKKKAQKNLQDTENLFRKNLQLKDVC